MIMKKLFFIISSFLLIITLVACGGQNSTTSDRNSESGNESSAATTEEDSTEAGSEVETAGDGTEGKTLVVYFSATGNTERVAEWIAETTGGELFKLEPVDPYTDEDLNYNDDDSRVSQEYADESLRNVELVADTADDWKDVEKVYIGYPVWWGIAAWPVNTFVEANDFTGKTVIPFCTSASSGLGDSGELLKEAAGAGNWLDGMRFSSGVSQTEVAEWIQSLGYSIPS